MDEKNGGPLSVLHVSKRGIFRSGFQNLGETLLGVLLVGALFRIRIDQGHPIRPILDSARFITDQIGTNARIWRLLFQPREPHVKIS